MSRKELKKYLIENVGDRDLKKFAILSVFGMIYRETLEEANELLNVIPKEYHYPNFPHHIGVWKEEEEDYFFGTPKQWEIIKETTKRIRPNILKYFYGEDEPYKITINNIKRIL